MAWTLSAAAAEGVSAEAQREARNAPVELEGVTVTATAVPTASSEVPASITLISGRELRERGVNDLRTALLLVAGVSAAPGGDAGAFGSQPILRGSSETDDYLLVVDGVPLGGAFNPATVQIDFNNVMQLEVLRGPSPVLYGAISFAGVLRIDHYPAGRADAHVQATVGSHGGRALQLALALPGLGDFRQSLSASAERLGSADRLHGLYRASVPLAGGTLRLDLDASTLRQSPASAALFSDSGQQLTRSDANFNPLDARLSDRRSQLNLFYMRPFQLGDLQFTLSASDALADHRRGALEVGGSSDDGGLMAEGVAQRRHLSEAYSDLHLVQRFGERLTLTSGLDALFGDAQQRSASFDYAIAADGARPNTAGTPANRSTQLGVTRRYAGLYTQAQWRVLAQSTLTAGLRLNRNLETRRLNSVVIDPADGSAAGSSSRDSRSATRLSGLIGYTQQLWHDQGGSDVVTGYANYRNAFKPADVDFGARPRGEILAPQSGQSVELGIKGRGLETALSFDFDVFLSRVKNVVIRDEASGMLSNAGEEGVSGAELEARYLIAPHWSVVADYSYTRARYRKLLLGGVDYAGKRLEFIPEHEGALGLLYSRPQGPLASIAVKAVGGRFLDRANQAPLGAYLTLDSTLGWNAGDYSVQIAGQNLSDRRVAVGITEFGEGQFYLLPGRSLRLILRAGF